MPRITSISNHIQSLPNECQPQAYNQQDLRNFYRFEDGTFLPVTSKCQRKRFQCTGHVENALAACWF